MAKRSLEEVSKVSINKWTSKCYRRKSTPETQTPSVAEKKVRNFEDPILFLVFGGTKVSESPEDLKKLGRDSARGIPPHIVETPIANEEVRWMMDHHRKLLAVILAMMLPCCLFPFAYLLSSSCGGR